MKAETVMSRMCAFRLTFASVVILILLNATPGYSQSIQALAIDPHNPTTLYAGTYGSGVFKSTDGGASWGTTGLTNAYISALAIDPVTPTTLYAGMYAGGVFKSTDGGASWNASGLTGSGVLSLAIDPLTPATLYAGDWGSFVYKSTDGGVSWRDYLLFPSASCGPCGAVRALAINHLIPTTLFLGTDPITQYYDDGSVYYAGPGEVFKSTNGGISWGTSVYFDTPYESVRSLAIAPRTDPRAPATLYAGTSGSPGVFSGVFRSTDEGVSWNATGLTSGGVSSLAIDLLTPTTLYAGTESAGVFKSTDGGASWIATGLTGVGGVTLVIDPLTPTTLYAGTGTSGVYKSTNSGVNWNPTGLFQHSPLSAVSFNPASVTGGTASTGTVTLSDAAPAGGATIPLSNSNPAVATVPVSVTVPAGATSATFAVSTNLVTVSTSVTISATYGSASSFALLTVTPATTLSSLSLNPTSVTGGTASTGTVTLSGSAPAGGATVALSSSNSAVATVPASVTVPAGAANASFTVSTTTCTSGAVTISGTYGGLTKSAGLTVTTTPDTLTIQQADYFASRQELRVAVMDTNSTATLQVYVTSTGQLIGQLTKGGDGTYRGQFTWPTNPQNITVQSNLCGRATKDVTLK